MIKKTLRKEEVIKKIVSKMADPGPGDWPPVCLVFTYQPKRPKIRRENNSVHSVTALHIG